MTREDVRKELSFQNAIPGGPWYTFDIERALDGIVRLRALVREAYLEGANDDARYGRAVDPVTLWEQSDARKALGDA